MQDITIIRSPNRRSVTIHIQPDMSIVVKAPIRFPEAKITKLLAENAAWITQKQRALRIRNEVRPENTYWYLGKTYPLTLRPTQKNIIEFEDKLYIALSPSSSLETYLTSWYKQQARKIINERVTTYADSAGLTYRSIGIGSAETRWGSCSSEKTLTFNWRLVMAPLPVIDYVVAHELAHLTELNHSALFWETVRKIYPLYREHRTWLKRHGHLLRV